MKTKKLWKADEPLRPNLQRRLPQMAADWFAHGREGLADTATYEQMHAFRLASKRFRYTLEIVEPAYGPGLPRIIETLKCIQTMLGDMNDLVVTREMLSGIDGTEAIRERLDRKSVALAARLRRLWRTQFEKAGLELRWSRYLGRYACRTKRLSTPLHQEQQTTSDNQQ